MQSACRRLSSSAFETVLSQREDKQKNMKSCFSFTNFWYLLNFNKCSWTVITNTLNSEWQINEMAKEIQLNNVITGNNYAITKARFIRANFSFKHTVSWGKNFSSCFRYQKKIIKISMKSLKLFLKTLPEQYEIFKLL